MEQERIASSQLLMYGSEQTDELSYLGDPRWRGTDAHQLADAPERGADPARQQHGLAPRVHHRAAREQQRGGRVRHAGRRGRWCHSIVSGAAILC